MRLLPALAAAALALSLSSVASAQGAPKPAPAPAAKKGKKDDKPQGPVASLLGFEAIPGAGTRIYVELNGSVNVTQHDAQGQVVYVLEGVQIKTSNTENSLELYYHNTPALRARLHRSKKDAELTIQLKADAKPTQKIVEGRKGLFRLEIDFPAGSFAPGAGAEDQPPPPPPPVRPIKEKDKKADSKKAEAKKPDPKDKKVDPKAPQSP